MQLLNLAFVGYEEFCRPWKVLFTLAFGLGGQHPPRSHTLVRHMQKLLNMGPQEYYLLEHIEFLSTIYECLYHETLS